MDRPTNAASRRVVNAGMTFCLAVTSIGVPGTCEAEPRDYAKIMQAAIRRSLGGDFREYEWVSYPTNNFGIATMYLLDSPRSKPSDKNQWCATYTCLGLEGKRAPADASARLTAGGFADVGTGGPITLSDEESRILAGEVFLPEILNVLGLGAQLAASGWATYPDEFSKNRLCLLTWRACLKRPPCGRRCRRTGSPLLSRMPWWILSKSMWIPATA